MSTNNVLQALKQKLIQEQEQGQNQQAPSPYSSRARRDTAAVPLPTVSGNLPAPSTSGSFVDKVSSQRSDLQDFRGSQERSHESRDRPSRYDNRSFHNRRDNYSRGERSDLRGFRDREFRDQRERIDQQDRNVRRYRERDSRDNRGYAERDTKDHRSYPDRDLRDPRGTRGYSKEERSYKSRDSYNRDDRRYRDRDTRGYNIREERGYNSRNERNDQRSRSDFQFNFQDTDLAGATSLNAIELKSLWDVKPKGFEKVSAERAKISGLFPLPGESKRIDTSKLEGLVQSGDINSQASILFAETKIDSVYSKISKQLILTGVEFTLFPVEKLVESLKKYIESLNLDESFIVSHELCNNRYLVLQLSNSNVTTILFASEIYLQKMLNLKLKFARPESYITPIPTQEESNESSSNIVIKDSGKKISILNVPTDITRDEILSDLEEIDTVGAIDLIMDVNSEFTGILFVEFQNLAPEFIVEKINQIVIQNTTLLSRLASTGIVSQESNISYRLFAKLVQNSGVRDSKVLILLNAVKPELLKSEEAYTQLKNDIMEECSLYGIVESIKIPKPQENYKRNVKNISSNVGKIFVKFSTLEQSKKALTNLHGKQYMDRTVLVSQIPESDYELNIF